MKTKILLFTIVFILGCSQNKLVPYFSSSHKNYDDVIKEYDKAKIYFNTDLKNFVLAVDTISRKDIPDDMKLSGLVRCQPLINKDGELASIITLKSINPVYDSLVINNIKKYKFKKAIDSNGEPTDYSVVVEYFFYQGHSFNPSINLTNTYHLLNTSQKDEVEYKNLNLNLYCYDYRFNAYFEELNKKLHTVWELPINYLREYPHWGRTVTAIVLGKNGKLLTYEILSHEGNLLLEQSSKSAIEKLFPLGVESEKNIESKLTILFDLNYEKPKYRYY